MTRAVFDTSTLAAAIFWPPEHRTSRLDARGPPTGAAVRYAGNRGGISPDLSGVPAQSVPDRSPLPFLGWIHHKALHCLPAPLGKQRSCDATDDPFLACAVAAEAKYVVASDRGLLSLGKPFGIMIVTPVEFIRRLAES